MNGRGARLTLLAGLIGGVSALSACAPPVPEPTVTPSLERSGAVLEVQVERILDRTFDELAAADAASDATLFVERVVDPAAAARATEYVVDAKGGADPDAISSDILAVYGTNADAWPRPLVAVVAPEDAAHTPVVLLLVQDDARGDYRMGWWAHMVPGGVLPAMPTLDAGATLLPLDATGFDLTPAEAIDAYVALLNEGEAEDAEAAFAPDPYREGMFSSRSSYSKAAKGRGGTYTDTVTALTADVVVLADAEGGALVFVPLEVVSDFNVPGAQLTLSAPDKALLSGTLTSRVVHRYEDLVVLRLAPVGSGLLPAVVAADHHLVSVATS